MATKKGAGPKAKKRRAPARGVAHIQSTFNNTIVTVTDTAGNTIKSLGCGNLEKGARKSTGHVAEQIAKQVGATVKEMGMEELDIHLKGAGGGRDAAVRGLAIAGLSILSICEKTGLPHNGCRRRKRKRN